VSVTVTTAQVSLSVPLLQLLVTKGALGSDFQAVVVVPSVLFIVALS
jgi:hypothetical protein